MGANDFGFAYRFEYKYLVSDAMAREIHRVLRFEMELDPYCAKAPENRYLVTSLYFDTPDCACYRATFGGEKNRFKLRARWYTGDLSKSVFFEEKHRINDVILKSRVDISQESIREMLAGREMSAHDLGQSYGKPSAEAVRLGDKCVALRARPACYVRYRREAWFSRNFEYLRMTLDADIEGHLLEKEATPAASPNWKRIHKKGVTVLEVKFERQIPHWVESMVRSFNLYRYTCSKYLNCMDVLKHPGTRLARPSHQVANFDEGWPLCQAS